jgi:pyruvate kinase
MRRTKIIATIGPATEEKNQIERLVEAGMNIARLNFSHGTEAQFKKIVKNIREVEKESGKIITIMQDLQGPKIRLGLVPDNYTVRAGDKVVFSTKPDEKGTVHLPYPALPKVVRKGQMLLIEDGIIRTKVLFIKDHHVCVKVIAGGTLKSKKGVNIPDSKLPAALALNAKDKKDLSFGIKLGVDAVAASFVESAADILRVKKEITKRTERKIPVIAKIERKDALVNLKEIIDAADGIMVARGDLGIETKAERVPVEQKRMVALARKMGKPSIVATQVLQSMVTSPVATRAEVSDAATAIFDHADAFMLSNETAVGAYPIKAVATLAKVAHETEEAIFSYEELSPALSSNADLEAIALNACIMAEESAAKFIVILTHEGFTAREILKHRPKTPVIVITDLLRTAKYLNFFWGIEKLFVEEGSFSSEKAAALLKKNKLIKKDDEIVVVKISDSKRSLEVVRI